MYSEEFLNGPCQNSFYFNEMSCFSIENQQIQAMYAWINSLI